MVRLLGSCSESWSLGLAILEPHAHAFVWYFFSLVWLGSLVVISLVVISLVVLCLQQATSTCKTSREASPKQRACTPARRARRERSGKQAARVHATASRATSVLASSTQANVQATLHMYVCVQVCSTCSSALSKCRASRPYVAGCECAAAQGRCRHERRALSRVVRRVLGLLHRVVRLHLVHCHHVSAYGDNVGGGWHAQRVDNACASRAAEVASALQSAFAPDVPAASQPTVSQWPVPQASHPAFDVQACVAT